MSDNLTMTHTFSEGVVRSAVVSMLEAQDKIEPGTGGAIENLSPSELSNMWKIAKAAIVGGLRQAARETNNKDWANAVAGCVVSILADRLEKP